MTEIPHRFQVCYFADLSSVEPTAEFIASLAKEVGDRKLLPSTYQELGPHGLRMRPRLQSPDNEWVVDLDRNRIDLQKNATSAGGENLGSLAEFCREAHGIIAGIVRVVSVKGKRLSLVTDAWLRDLSNGALNEAYARLFNALPYYQESPPAAWTSRSVRRVPARLGGRDETLNVIITADRARRRFLFDSSGREFESIGVQVDINTFQGNTETRFSAESLPDFLERAMDIRKLLLQQLRERLDG